jgi:hypothetical protein
MAKKRDDDIEQKLEKLELAIQDELREEELSRQEERRDVAKAEKDDVATTDGELAADLYCIGGLVALAVGMLMVFSHMRIGTGALAWFGWGSAGGGFVFLPLLVGIGMIFYNSKWRAGYIVCGVGVALIMFTILSQLVITFPFVSAISFILMFLPLAAGIGLMLKGVGMRKQLKKDND